MVDSPVVETNRKIVKVMFGIPNEGHTEPLAYDNRLAMAIHFGTLQALSSQGVKKYSGIEYDYPDNTEYEFYLRTVGHTFPALARESLCTDAVDAGMDYVFMIDDDMVSEVDIFERLIKNNVDICAALAFTRFKPYKPVLYELNSGYDPVARKNYYINTPIFNYPKDKLVQCDAVGFGAVLIKTEVFKKMKKPWFMTTSGPGEDIFFCHSAGKAGFDIFMDTRVKIGHVPSGEPITEEDYEKQDNIKELKETHPEFRCY